MSPASRRSVIDETPRVGADFALRRGMHTNRVALAAADRAPAPNRRHALLRHKATLSRSAAAYQRRSAPLASQRTPTAFLIAISLVVVLFTSFTYLLLRFA